MDTLSIIYQLLKHRINMFFLKTNKPKQVKKQERIECYFDECKIINKHIMAFKNECRVIDFDDNEVKKYDDVISCLSENPDINVIMRSVISNEIINYVYQNYKDHFISISAPNENDFRYYVQVISFDSLIKLFSEPTDIDRNTKILLDSIGFRFTHINREAGIDKFKCLSLDLNNNQIINGEPFTMASNFKSLLSIFNNKNNELMDIFLINDKFMETVSQDIKDYDNILKCILGDDEFDDLIKFNKIF